jgi:hypothetical protein
MKTIQDCKKNGFKTKIMKQKEIFKTLKNVAMFSIFPIESSFDVWVMFGCLLQIESSFDNC